MIVTRVVVGLALVFGVLGEAAFALDVPIPAKVGIVKPLKLAKLVAKDANGFPLPLPPDEDPTVLGAEVQFFDTGGTGGSFAHTLPAAGWIGLGNPQGSKGYKYKGSLAGDATCTTVLIKTKVIKAVCKGSDVTLSTPFSGNDAVVLAIPDAAGPALQYCAELGGTESRNDEKGLKRTGAAPPGICPAFSPPATATATASQTATQTATATGTRTATATVTSTPPDTATPADTATRTITATATGTRTPTITPTVTSPPVDTATRTDTPTQTATATASQTQTATATASITSTPTNTSIALPGTPTNSPTNSPTASFTVTATRTRTSTATGTSTRTSTVTATPTRTGTSTQTPTATPTHPPVMCGNGFLEPGETCASCPADCVISACTPGATPTMVSFAVQFDGPLGTSPTTTTVLIGYRSSRVSIPGTGGATSVRQRITFPPPLPNVATPNDLDYALREIVGRNAGLTDGLLFTVKFDRCTAAPAVTQNDFGCTVEACAGSGGPIAGCTCLVTAP